MDAPASPRRNRLEGLLLLALLLFSIQSAYLAAYATPDLLYPANVLLHGLGGAVLLVPLAWWTWRRLVWGGTDRGLVRWCGLLGAWLMLVSGALAVALMVVANTQPNRWLLHAHIATAIPAALLLYAYIAMRARAAESMAERRAAVAALLAVVVAVPMLLAFRLAEDDYRYVIRNPALPPLSMDEEGMGGKDGPFHPSSAHTSTKGKIKSTFFMTSQSCGQSNCHPDITQQWQSSMHRMSSFNNQWYRKSIEYMQSVVGTQPSKWCAGCHDHAVIFNGMFDRPVIELIDTAEAHVGLACASCHSITEVHSTMGQGDFTIEYPPLHDLAVSDNFFLKTGHDLFLRLDPEAHSKTFLKPFHTQQRAEFCSSCHKVHLDKAVNGYRWIRGFNEYDNWQGSGVSGMGARSFYYPKKPMDCVDCHMPLVPSKDKGNHAGKVHSHRFPGANTAVPFVNGDEEQLRAVQEFLKGTVTVDIFSLEHGAEDQELVEKAGAVAEARMASTFAIGEEGGASAPGGFLRGGPIEVVAPIDRSNATVRRGESARVDVVVRTRSVGHFFPGGTVDAFDVWVELKAEDENGKLVFWSGEVLDGGKGPVEPGAHFYRSLMVDENGNPINKRNAWATRAVLYVRLVPPGAADTVHYRLRIPEDAGDKIKLSAKLNYRKFAWYNTQWAYAGVPDPAHADKPVAPSYDDRPFVFTGPTDKVSGRLKSIPDLPITEIHAAEATLAVIDRDAPLPATRIEPGPNDRERWNDWGIGLLLQGDLRAALHAFEKVTALEPGYVDGWVNIARVRVREGEPMLAMKALERALAIDPKLARGHFFRSQALKALGDYDEALRHLMETYAQYPKDRVVLNELGRLHFLKRDFQGAAQWTEKVMAIDPEDLMAHYTLMLSYKGLGDKERSERHRQLYERFKIDEDAQARTGHVRRTHPEDNNERQAIHEHRWTPLAAAATQAGPTAAEVRQ